MKDDGERKRSKSYMVDEPVSALALYPGWEAHQHLLIQAIGDLTPDQLAQRTTERLRNVSETCLHIIGARARWSRFELGLRDAALIELGEWDDDGMPVRTAAELVAGLRATWAPLREALAGWTPHDLAQTVPNSAPAPGEPDVFTRQWIIWHLIEHDIHHAGEITEILGTFGLPGLDI